jgi:diadenosine tetraphosphate (Ap4A) HIT family hydrolase
MAREFLSYDEAQVDYYIGIVKRWPKITLTKHNVIRAEGDYWSLNLDNGNLTDGQRDELIQICNEKIKAYVGSYNGIIGDYRYNPNDLSSKSIRYLVLKLAHGRCALCGASIKDTPIDIDHIVHRNKGGTNEVSNHQALCYRCNRAKRDRDATDFRDYGLEERSGDCVFCRFEDRIVEAYNTAVCVRDAFPVTDHHSLVIPRRHAATLNDLVGDEISDLFQLAKVVKAHLLELDKSIAGFNIGINEGQAAGQTIKHLHLHVIPRRPGDVPNPRGGIRGIIPGKADYLSA